MPTLTSAWSTSATATIGITRKVWVKSIELPALNAHIYVDGPWMPQTKNKTRSVRQALGRAKAIVLGSIEGGYEFNMVFSCEGSDFDTLMALIDSDTTLYVENESQEWYVKVSGDIKIEDYLLDGSEEQTYRVTVPVVEVDRP